jgi:type II secretory pathway component PulF
MSSKVSAESASISSLAPEGVSNDFAGGSSSHASSLSASVEVTKLRLSPKEKLNLITNLATMLSAGIPILETVEVLANDTKGNQQKILKILLEDLNQGLSISASFGRSPKAFDPVTLNLLRSAEESGSLDSALTDLAENIKEEIEFTSKVRGALIYPFIIFLLFLGIMLVILIYVVPRISDVFRKLKLDLPLTTRVLIWSSETFLAYWPFIIAGSLVIIALLTLLFVRKKREVVSLLFSLPLISRLARQIDLARFTKSFGLLLTSGIPIVLALEYSEHSVAKKDMARAIRKARDTVSSGKPLSEGLSLSKKLFPDLMIRIVSAGERSGALEESMGKLNDQFELGVSSALKTVTTMLEPILLVIIGLFVGGMMLSIIAPIYQLIGGITAR